MLPHVKNLGFINQDTHVSYRLENIEQENNHQTENGSSD